MRVVIAGGGTAGHVFPGLALASTLAREGHGVSFVGTDRGLEARLVPAAGFPFHAVEARPLVRKASLAALAAPLQALRGLKECRAIVRGADVVVGMGGYVSVPAVLAAKREGVPVALHEQNAIPGLANRVMAPLAEAVAISFEATRRRLPRRVRKVLSGNPVREQILKVREDREALAKECRRELDLEETRRTLLVFGGSQGALRINRAALGACRLMRDRSDLQIVIITGSSHLQEMQRESSSRGASVPVRLVGFMERMELCYAAADLVVSRSGATTVAELTVCGLPSLLIPYPYATGQHQEANARALQRAGAASVMRDERLTAESLWSRVESLMDHAERLESMQARAAGLGTPDAADRLAAVVAMVAMKR